MHVDGIFERLSTRMHRAENLKKYGIMNVCLKGRKFCFIATVTEWINKESDSQEIPNPAVSPNTNPTCNDATISLKMWGGVAQKQQYPMHKHVRRK